MKKLIVRVAIVYAILCIASTSNLAETITGAGSAPIGASVASAGTFNLTILDRLDPAVTADAVGFNSGTAVPSSGIEWLVADHLLYITYECNDIAWKIRMVTDNWHDIAGVTHAKNIDGTMRFMSGMIRSGTGGPADIYNRPKVAWQVYTDLQTPDTLNDNYVYGLDLDGEDPREFDDEGDIAPHWSLISDKGDSSFSGWDANGDGDYLDTADTDGYDFNADEDYLDSQDTDGDGIDDDFEYPPDVEPNGFSANFALVIGAGANQWLMGVPPDNNEVPNGDGADGSLYIYLGADFRVAASTYGTTIYVELVHE